MGYSATVFGGHVDWRHIWQYSNGCLFVWCISKTDCQHKNRCFSAWCWLQNSWKQYLYRRHWKVNDNSPTAVSDVFPEVTSQVKPPAVPSWLCNKTSHPRLYTKSIREYGTMWFNARNWFELLITKIYLIFNFISVFGTKNNWDTHHCLLQLKGWDGLFKWVVSCSMGLLSGFWQLVYVALNQLVI